MKIQKLLLILAIIFMTVSTGLAVELNTIMMEATCKIIAPGTVGTGFIIGKPDPENPSKAFYTLITANHVLQAACGELATLVLRQKQKDGKWRRIEIPVRVRQGKKPLLQKHAVVDLAAMFVRLPKDVVTTLLTTDLLIDDNRLNEYELHPGLEVLCLGYPFGAEANAQGFPILRSGRIASYPLTPTKETKTFLFDFTVFRGNSGGPVYFVHRNPTYGGSVRLGATIYGILGVVVRERNITEKIQELYEKKEKITPLQLGEVIHASFIRELVDSMEPPKK